MTCTRCSNEMEQKGSLFSCPRCGLFKTARATTDEVPPLFGPVGEPSSPTGEPESEAAPTDQSSRTVATANTWYNVTVYLEGGRDPFTLPIEGSDRDAAALSAMQTSEGYAMGGFWHFANGISTFYPFHRIQRIEVTPVG